MIKYSQNNENGLVLHAAFTFKASKLNDKFVYYYVSMFSLSIKKNTYQHEHDRVEKNKE